MTALHFGSGANRIEIARTLLNHGAAVNAVTTTRSWWNIARPRPNAVADSPIEAANPVHS